jgi:hypothetical protein
MITPTTTHSKTFDFRQKNYINNGAAFLAVILFSFFGNFNLLAQTDTPSEWELVKAKDGINVFSQIMTCDIEGAPNPFDYVVFKVENTTEGPLTIGLHFEIYFEEGCNGCGGSEETSTALLLEGGSSIESTCADPVDQLAYFILNPGFADSWIYTHSQVQINVIQ